MLESSAKDRLVPAPYRTHASFLAAIHAGEPLALRQLFLFYTPLLRDQARQLGVPSEERDSLVITVLDDVVMFLQDSASLPRSVGSYLVGSLRNRARNQHRAKARELARDESAYSRIVGTGERIVAECHSEYSVREALSSSREDIPGVGVVVAKLAAMAAVALNDTETRLMVGMSRNVPLRDLADQAGISYGAARVRIHRVRARFMALTSQFRETLAPEEQQELDRFLRRAGVALDARASAIPPITPPKPALTPDETTDDTTR